MAQSRSRVAVGVVGSVVVHVAVAAGILLLPMRSSPPPAVTGTATITDATRGIPGGPASRRKDEREQPPGVGATVQGAATERRGRQPGPITTPSVLATAVRMAGQSFRAEVVAPLESRLSPSARRVLRHLWISTIFTVGIWVMTLLVRRQSARVRHWLWMAASLKFFVPISLVAPGVTAAAVGEGTWMDRLAPLAIPVWLLGLVVVLLARHRDDLTPALHKVTEAAFWFHPAVWWIGWHLRAERQRACDEAITGPASVVVIIIIVVVTQLGNGDRLPADGDPAGARAAPFVALHLIAHDPRSVSTSTRRDVNPSDG